MILLFISIENNYCKLQNGGVPYQLNSGIMTINEMHKYSWRVLTNLNYLPYSVVLMSIMLKMKSSQCINVYKCIKALSFFWISFKKKWNKMSCLPTSANQIIRYGNHHTARKLNLETTSTNYLYSILHSNYWYYFIACSTDLLGIFR